MNNKQHDEPAARIACDLVRLLNVDAPAEDFAQRMVEVESLPESVAMKSALLETVRMAMAVRNRLELQRQREHGMLAVIESAQELSSRLDLNSLLGAIVSRARSLLGSDVVWLSVHDASRDEFHVLLADGALSQGTFGMVAKTDHGVASVVMSTRLPFVTADYLHDSRFKHDAQLDETFRTEGISALVGVPLIWDNAVIGLLFAADRYHRTHSAQSISILCTLATHAAVALKNARDFERTTAALESADLARAELEHHLKSIQAAADAHEQMTSLLARGASLATLCEAVANLLNGALLVLDEAGQVVSRGVANGYEGSLAQGYEPYGPHSAEVAAALRQSRQLGRSVHAYSNEGEDCRVVSVIGGDDMLGAIALFHRRELEEVAVRTLERSSSVIGIVLLSQERMEASRSRNVSVLLRSLVSPRQDEPSVLLDQAERHGLALTQPLTLLLLEMSSPGASYTARRLRSMPQLAGALVDDIDGIVVVLCGTTRSSEVRDCISAWARGEPGTRYRGVVSRPLSGSGEVPAIFGMLKRALSVLKRLGVQDHLVAQNELAVYSALFETHDQSSLAQFLESTIGPVVNHDARRGTELASTLLHYFESNQNAKLTAQQLGIHVNTVRQRLATIEELLGHLGQVSRALEIHIALRLWSLRQPEL